MLTKVKQDLCLALQCIDSIYAERRVGSPRACATLSKYNERCFFAFQRSMLQRVAERSQSTDLIPFRQSEHEYSTKLKRNNICYKYASSQDFTGASTRRPMSGENCFRYPSNRSLTLNEATMQDATTSKNCSVVESKTFIFPIRYVQITLIK